MATGQIVQANAASPAEEEARALTLGVLPASLKRRQERCEAAIKVSEVTWQECLAFLDGDQHVYVDANSGRLERLETLDGSARKPRWRPRTTRNRFTTTIFRSASIVGSRMPGYECVPENGDPKPKAGALMGEKVLRGLYDKLGLRSKFLDVGVHAAATGAGFAMPFWDPHVGNPVYGLDGELVASQGEVDVAVLGQGEVLWDPGSSFERSRYYFVRQAQVNEEVVEAPWYRGPKKLTADARAPIGQWRHSEETRDLVFVWQYFERPCERYPRGRWLRFANDRLIAEPADYPYAPVDRSKPAVDRPCLHRMPWYPRVHRHRDMGIGEQLLDVQRTYNRTMNQIIAWKNLVLNPQMMAPEDSLISQLTDEPGAVFVYRPIGGQVPQRLEAPDIPMSLYTTLDRCIADFEEIAGQTALPAGIEAASAVAAVDEREAGRRGITTSNLAQFHADVGRHILHLVREHYTEQRLLVIQGRFSTELVEGFMGTQLDGIVDVRVSESSVAPRSRAEQKAQITYYADKGWIDPHQAMAALNGGTAESLIDDYELDVDKARRVIDHICRAAVQGPERTLDAQGRPLPLLPEPGAADNLRVHADVFKQWMKTRDFEREPVEVREAAATYVQMCEAADQERQMTAAQLTSAQARGLGEANAGAPQGPGGNAGAANKPMPSLPSMESNLAAAQGVAREGG